MSNQVTGDGIDVHGGVGGTVAVLERLRGAALSLRAAATLLDDAGASARWADTQVWSAPGEAGEAGAAARAAQEAIDPLVRGRAALAARAEAVQDLAGRLDRATRAYADAEDRAGVLLRGLLGAAGHSVGNRPLLGVVGAVVAGGGIVRAGLLAGAALHLSGRGVDPRRMLLRADLAELVVQGVAGVVGGLGPGTGRPSTVPVVGASGLLTGGAAGAGLVVPSLRRRPLRVTARLEASGPATAPSGAADLLERVGALYPRSGGTAGTVGVDRLDHPDGTRTWVVAIPGTQTGTPGTGANPMDMATNLRLMATKRDDVSELVSRALEQSGARPDEPVLLAGHSQGGMVAMALAGSAAFTARHRVTAVLTAGSPVATMPLPSGTSALHLEHRQDLVPALDGWGNPDRPHRTTAVRDLATARGVDDRLAARSPGAAHEVSTYARTARAVTAAGGASVREWERVAAGVLGDPGTTAVHREFSGERAAPRGRALAPGPHGPGPVGVTSGGSPR